MNKEFRADGYGLKNQGGNEWGDFHIIGSSDTQGI